MKLLTFNALWLAGTMGVFLLFFRPPTVRLGPYQPKNLHMSPGNLSSRQGLLLGHRIDVNRAQVVDWIALPGIGPGIACKIVDFREQHGTFTEIEELAKVPGLGPQRIAELSPYLVVNP